MTVRVVLLLALAALWPAGQGYPTDSTAEQQRQIGLEIGDRPARGG